MEAAEEEGQGVKEAAVLGSAEDAEAVADDVEALGADGAEFKK